jgi:hypothetical protein
MDGNARRLPGETDKFDRRRCHARLKSLANTLGVRKRHGPVAHVLPNQVVRKHELTRVRIRRRLNGFSPCILRAYIVARARKGSSIPDVTVPMLERAPRRLRDLVRLIDKQKRKPVYSDFEDLLGGENLILLPPFADAANDSSSGRTPSRCCARTRATSQSRSCVETSH